MWIDSMLGLKFYLNAVTLTLCFRYVMLLSWATMNKTYPTIRVYTGQR
jgi:hypothetical protein